MRKSLPLIIVFVSAVMSATFVIMLLMTPVHAQDRPGLSERVTVQELKTENGRAELIRLQAMVDHNSLLIAGLADQMSMVKGIGIGFGGVLCLLQIIQILSIKKSREE